MQAAVIYKPGDIRLEDVPKPTAKKGEALLRCGAVGENGSAADSGFEATDGEPADVLSGDAPAETGDALPNVCGTPAGTSTVDPARTITS